MYLEVNAFIITPQQITINWHIHCFSIGSALDRVTSLAFP